MNLFNLFRRKKKLNYRGDYDKLERFLEENNLMGYDGKAIIYQDVFTAFFHEIDQIEYPDYYQFRQELKAKEERQQVCFKEMVDANFSNDSTEKFLFKLSGSHQCYLSFSVSQYLLYLLLAQDRRKIECRDSRRCESCGSAAI